MALEFHANSLGHIAWRWISDIQTLPELQFNNAVNVNWKLFEVPCVELNRMDCEIVRVYTRNVCCKYDNKCINECKRENETEIEKLEWTSEQKKKRTLKTKDCNIERNDSKYWNNIEEEYIRWCSYQLLVFNKSRQTFNFSLKDICITISETYIVFMCLMIQMKEMLIFEAGLKVTMTTGGNKKKKHKRKRTIDTKKNCI